MANHTSTSRAEAERLLALAEKLLANKDLTGSKQFAILAQEAEPLLEGSDQILAIIEVLLASQTKLNNHPNWYQILQVDPKVNDVDFIKKQYRRLALLLHPDKNKFAFAESAFHLVSDAWGVLSNPGRKSVFDNQLGLNFTRVDLEKSRMEKENEMQHHHNSAGNYFPASGGGGGGVASFSSAPKKRGRPKGSLGKGPRKVGGNGLSGGGGGGKRGLSGGGDGGGQRGLTFWTGCPYCYNLYEYPRKYEGCCMRCVKCKKGFTAEGIGYEPPVVPGKEEYYCNWGIFPMGFRDAGSGARGGGVNGFASWMPGMQNGGKANVGIGGGGGGGGGNVAPKPKEVLAAVPVASAGVNGAAPVVAPGSSLAPKKKRGRPRKNPLP